MEIITRENRTIWCPECNLTEDISVSIFDEMINIRWINFLEGQIINIPLKCECGHKFKQKFIFTRRKDGNKTNKSL